LDNIFQPSNLQLLTGSILGSADNTPVEVPSGSYNSPSFAAGGSNVITS